MEQTLRICRAGGRPRGRGTTALRRALDHRTAGPATARRVVAAGRVGRRFRSGRARAEAGISQAAGDAEPDPPAAASQADDGASDAADDDFEVPPTNGKAFPRLKERDPYKLLGVSHSASYDEVKEARSFLTDEYRGHIASVEAIEIAHDKVISGSFKERRQEGMKPAPGRRARGGAAVAADDDDGDDEEGEGAWGPLSPFIRRRVPRRDLLRTCVVFAAVLAWLLLTALEGEPTAQVTTGLAACTYFVQQRRQKRAGDKEANVFWGAFGTAVVATAAGWVVGNVVPAVFPNVLPESVGIGAVCTAFALLAQWFTSAFVK